MTYPITCTVEFNDKRITADAGIIDHLVEINKLGLVTLASCSGMESDHGKPKGTYISIQLQEGLVPVMPADMLREYLSDPSLYDRLDNVAKHVNWTGKLGTYLIAIPSMGFYLPISGSVELDNKVMADPRWIQAASIVEKPYAPVDIFLQQIDERNLIWDNLWEEYGGKKQYSDAEIKARLDQLVHELQVEFGGSIYKDEQPINSNVDVVQMDRHINTSQLLDEMGDKYPLAVDDITGMFPLHEIYAMGFTEEDYANREKFLSSIKNSTTIPWMMTLKEFTSLPDPISTSMIPFGKSPSEFHLQSVVAAMDDEDKSIPFKVIWDYEELLTRPVLTDMAVEFGLSDADINQLSDSDLKEFVYDKVFEFVELKYEDTTPQDLRKLSYEKRRKEALRKKAGKERVGYGQQSLTSAISTSRRLTEFSDFNDNDDAEERIEDIKDKLDKLALQEGV